MTAGGADDGDGARLARPQRQLGDDSCVKAFNGGLENQLTEMTLGNLAISTSGIQHGKAGLPERCHVHDPG